MRKENPEKFPEKNFREKNPEKKYFRKIIFKYFKTLGHQRNVLKISAL